MEIPADVVTVAADLVRLWDEKNERDFGFSSRTVGRGLSLGVGAPGTMMPDRLSLLLSR